MGTHFRFLRKLFCSKIPFVRIPICSRIVSNVFELPVSRKSTFCSRDPCCLTSFLNQNLPIFAKAQQLQGQNPHLFECPFVRERTVASFLIWKKSANNKLFHCQKNIEKIGKYFSRIDTNSLEKSTIFLLKFRFFSRCFFWFFFSHFALTFPTIFHRKFVGLAVFPDLSTFCYHKHFFIVDFFYINPNFIQESKNHT